ncbi:anaerobic ribonucleoside-triphosphate reductase activating protein [Segatella albensis]|jgi:anaerobic ribonucleoside-triphosphate reductase activating protein|uniref:anaerobic ribonucleoside-triphosphate reductase activating protein n=1 Tax=Segatella albensis TaxID=77768 RepID=UPI0004690129|nr:anaerobic ribonucleoside-triphosphate reductase activating protein [Segatella albensis]
MLKYVNTGIVFQEIPDEMTLSINISNCPCHCPGCHSSYLWQDIGEPLTPMVLEQFIQKYEDEITCICFMGGDAEPKAVNDLAVYLHREHPQYKVGWYSGRTHVSTSICKSNFDYIKVGPYIKHLGCLKDMTTNQRLYKRVSGDEFSDITSRFWRKKD